MRKKGILLCFMSLLLLGGCEKNENTPNPQETPQQEENQKPEVSLSENLWDFEFSIGEDEWKLPQELSKWEEKGWSMEEKQKETMLDGETYIEGEILRKQGQEISVNSHGAIDKWVFFHQLYRTIPVFHFRAHINHPFNPLLLQSCKQHFPIFVKSFIIIMRMRLKNHVLPPNLTLS